MEKLAEYARTIAQLTAQNDHSQALYIAALAISPAGCLASAARGLMLIRDAEQGLPCELVQYRNGLYQRVMQSGRGKYGDDWQIIHNAM